MYDPGHILGPYRVVRVIGEGGAAAVFEVVDQASGETFALKVLGLRTQQLTERFKREAKILSKLIHPNILTIYELVDVDGDRPAIRMEYVQGESLNAWMASHPDRDLAASMAVFDQILAGLAHAHSQGIIHRDLKPANVLLDRSGAVKIADFGIAKSDSDNTLELTKPEMALGTPSYTAPEQVTDASKVTQRADIFSMGCILYDLVCGRQAFDQRGIMQRIMAMGNSTYPDPDALIAGLDPNIVWAIHGALVPESANRIADCETLRAVLDGATQFRVEGKSLQHVAEPPREQTETEPMPNLKAITAPKPLVVRPPKRSHLVPILAAGLLLGVIIGAGVVTALLVLVFVAIRLM